MTTPGGGGDRLDVEVVVDATGFGKRAQTAIDAEVRGVRARIKAEIDSRRLQAQAEAAARRTEKNTRVNLKVGVDARYLRESIKGALAGLTGTEYRVRVVADVDTRAAEARLAALGRGRSGGGGTGGGGDGGAEARRTAQAEDAVTTAQTRSRAAQEALSRARDGAVGRLRGYRLEVAASALAEERAALAVARARERLARVNANPKSSGTDKAGAELGVRQAEQNLARVQNASRGLTRTVQGAISSLSRFGLVAGGIQLAATAVTALGGGLVSLVASASQAVGVLGAIPNLIGIAAQGIGTVLAGFSGIGDAVTAMGKAETAGAAASTGAGKARAAAQKRIASAQKAAKRATEAADRTAQDGAKAVAAAEQRRADVRTQAASRVQGAEDSFAAAQRSSQRAQENLTRAREEATDRLKDYQLQLSGAALDEQAAALAVERARERLDQANRSPGSSDLDRREAALALDQAVQGLAEVRDRNADLRKEASDAATAGVEGSTEVVAAKEEVANAAQAEADAETELRDTRVQAARDVADADADLAETIADSAQANADAQDAVVDAMEGVQEAIDAATEAANASTPAQTALAAALDKLSPAGRRFAEFVNGTLKPRLEELKKGVQEALLPGVQAGVEAALPLLDTLQTGLQGTGTILGDVARRAGEMAGSPLFRADVATIMESNNRATSSFGDAGLSLLNVFRNLAVAAGPLVERFADFIAVQADLLDKFIANKRETGELGEFFDEAGDKAALLGGILADVVVGIFNIGRAAKPAGDQLLQSLADAAQRFRDFTGDPASQAKFREFFDKMAPLVEKIGGLFTTLVQIVVQLGENGGGALGGFVDTLQVMADAVLAVLNSPFGPFVSAILTLSGVAGAIGLVGGKIAGIAESITGLVSGVTEGVTSVTDFVGGLQEGVGQLQEGASTAREWGAKIRDAASGAATFARDLGSKVSQGVSTAASAVGSLGSRVASGLSSGASAVGTFASNLGTRVAGAASSAAGAVGRMATAVGQGAAAFATSAANAGRAAAAWAAQAAAGVAVAAKNAIVTASTWALNAAQGALNAIMAINPFVLILIAIAALVAAFIYAWQNSETFRDIVTSVLTAIRDAAVAVFDFLVGYYRAVWDTISSIFTTVVGAISDFLSAAWETIKSVATTVFGAISSFFSSTWETIKSVFSGAIGIVSGAWSSFWSGLQSVASSIWSAIGGGISGFLDGAKSAFSTAVSVISTVWDGLKAAVRAPVAFVVNTVYNRGIVPVWNFVSGLFDGPQLDEYTLPEFAKGGVVGGGYRPGVDNQLIRASPGEGILVPEAVRGIGGARGVEAINSHFSNRVSGPGLGRPSQEDHGKPPAYAGGGVLDFIGDAASAVADGIGNVASNIADAVSNGWKTAVRIGLSPFRSLANSTLPDNRIGELLKGTVGNWFDKIEEFVGGKERENDAKILALAGDVGSGVQRWAPLVQEVLRELGQSPSLTPQVLQLISHESGGNPNAINRTDINAQRGYPSQGLMQTIPQTFAAHAGPYKSRGITDPKANIYAGLHYGIARYGSVSNIPGIRSLAQGGGYKPYDRGGPWKSGTLGGNTSGHTEGVLTGHPGGGMDALGGWDRLYALNRGVPLETMLAGSRVSSTDSSANGGVGTMLAEGAVQLTVYNPREQTTEETLNTRMSRLAASGIFKSAP